MNVGPPFAVIQSGTVVPNHVVVAMNDAAAHHSHKLRSLHVINDGNYSFQALAPLTKLYNRADCYAQSTLFFRRMEQRGAADWKLSLRQKCKRTAAPIRRVYTFQTDIVSCTPSSRQDRKHNQDKLVKERVYARIPITNAPVD